MHATCQILLSSPKFQISFLHINCPLFKGLMHHYVGRCDPSWQCPIRMVFVKSGFPESGYPGYMINLEMWPASTCPDYFSGVWHYLDVFNIFSYKLIWVWIETLTKKNTKQQTGPKRSQHYLEMIVWKMLYGKSGSSCVVFVLSPTASYAAARPLQ